LAYAKKNFEDNKDFYIGKTVNTLFYDIEVYSQYGWILDRRNDFKEYGVEFRLSPFGRDYSKYKDMEITYVEIYFLNKNLPKIDMQKYSALQDEYMYQDVDLIWAWEPINSKFYGDCVIKDIRVCKYRYSNPPQEIYP
jgi:hypothetical protein